MGRAELQQINGHFASSLKIPIHSVLSNQQDLGMQVPPRSRIVWLEEIASTLLEGAHLCKLNRLDKLIDPVIRVNL